MPIYHFPVDKIRVSTPYAPLGFVGIGGGAQLVPSSTFLDFQVIPPLQGAITSIFLYRQSKSGVSVGTVQYLVFPKGAPISYGILGYSEPTSLTNILGTVNLTHVLPTVMSSPFTIEIRPAGTQNWNNWNVLFDIEKFRLEVNTTLDLPPPSAAPQANFTTAGTKIAMRIKFINQSTNYGAVEWDFGDGSKSVEGNPEHQYLRGGSYSVKLTVRKGVQSDTKIKTVAVEQWNPPPPGSGSPVLPPGTVPDSGSNWWWLLLLSLGLVVASRRKHVRS